jgi:hypothetical protein
LAYQPSKQSIRSVGSRRAPPKIQSPLALYPVGGTRQEPLAGLLDYVQILYGNKGSQQKYGLEVPQMKKNT